MAGWSDADLAIDDRDRGDEGLRLDAMLCEGLGVVATR
jgi:hypothetical protein